MRNKISPTESDICGRGGLGVGGVGVGIEVGGGVGEVFRSPLEGWCQQLPL